MGLPFTIKTKTLTKVTCYYDPVNDSNWLFFLLLLQNHSCI